jgi:hypothetical protein
MVFIIAVKVDADGGGTLKPSDGIKLIETVANCGFESHNRYHIEVHLATP